MFTGVFYAGSDDRFDYIAVEHRDVSTTWCRVPRGEISIAKRMAVESNRKSWTNITKDYPPPWDNKPGR